MSWISNFPHFSNIAPTDMFQSKFESAAERVKQLQKRPSDEELLQLYGLYKQANVGDNNTPCPGLFQWKDKAKWEAWRSRKGISNYDARNRYVTLADSLIAKYG